METGEFYEILILMLDDAAAIVHNQQILAGIHSQLDRNLLNPLEQDYIYRDHFGQFPAEPKSIVHNGVTIRTRILHQTGTRLSDIRGADLLYEVKDEKFGLIQYKRAARGIVHNDAEQLEALLGSCPEVCRNRQNRPLPLGWVPTKVFSFCGCWYQIIDEGQEWYLPACEAEAIFQGRNSKRAELFKSGLTKNTFLELFASCRIGALLRRRAHYDNMDTYTRQLLEDMHAILEVRQLGRWTAS
jgi:hypothetical protein